MENGLDLTLRLSLPSPITVDTNLSIRTPSTDQGINVVYGGRRDNNVGGGMEIHHRNRNLPWDADEVRRDAELVRNNINVNVRVYNLVFNQFAGMGETLNFSPYPMPASSSSDSSLTPAPAAPAVNEYVLIDVPARRAYRNSTLAAENALDANASQKCRQGCRGCCCSQRKCTNINCNAVSTPMWRRGPLGPKSLCNACGIKYRKEEDRKSKRAQANDATTQAN
ncbi:unnamed protein product [Microthlaspi erraticum]|uniref:GATA-type domain-containing protein n=1 Tax=Microthlaspi erraticum TaxID=1685480 RepID=A0A6D2HHS2_9BRAS|nr:unnamed protein product [Microthlaspi erraticum]